MIRPAQIQPSRRVKIVAVVQDGPQIVNIQNVVRDRTLAAQLPDQQISHSKISSKERYLSAGDFLFPLELRCELQRSTDSARRIANPEVAGVNRIQRNVDLRWLRCEFADLGWKNISAMNIQFVFSSSQNESIKSENIITGVGRSFC